MRRAETTKGLKEQELHIRQRESEEANRLDIELKDQVGALQNDTEGFVKIWNMVRTSSFKFRCFDKESGQIEDDIRSITFQLNSVIETQSDLPEVLDALTNFISRLFLLSCN